MGGAQAFATVAHEGQRYGEHPYTDHLMDVVGVAIRYGFDLLGREFIDACWLHDVVEDTDTTIEEIEAQGWSLNPGRYVPFDLASLDTGDMARLPALIREFDELTESAVDLSKTVAQVLASRDAK